MAKMSEEHKAALAAGAKQTKAVKAYLEGLQDMAPKKGRQRTEETVAAQLEAAKAVIADKGAGVLDVLNARQAESDLETELEAMNTDTGPDMKALEKDFSKHVAAYGERKGITYSTWRRMGIAGDVLTAAGVPRTRS
jgi:hypothetical protein